MIDLSKLRYFKTPEDIILFIRVCLCLVIIRLLLKMVRIPRILELIEPRNKKAIDASRLDHVNRFTNFFVYSLSRSRNPCLHRSLVLYRYLRMMGMDVQIVFAVRKSSGELEGHAWLEYNHKPFLAHGGSSEEYKMVMTYPSEKHPIIRSSDNGNR